MPLSETKEIKQQDEIIGEIHPPIFHRQLTENKYLDLTNRIKNGDLSIPAALHQLRRYTAPSDEKFVTPLHHKALTP